VSVYTDPWLNRLQMEHNLVQEYCANSDVVSYTPSCLKENMPPHKYLVKYEVRSISHIDATEMPVYANCHYVSIELPNDYPVVSGPICRMETDIWHPNIRSEGVHKGRICINSNVLGAWFTLDLLINQIGEMIQYKNYHALHIKPYPEDPVVAQWVLTVAEPKGIVDKAKSICTDNTQLQHSSPEWRKTRKKENPIRINKIKKASVHSNMMP